MAKPSIDIPSGLSPWLRAWSDKFEEFNVNEDLEAPSGWRQVVYSGKFSRVLSVALMTSDQLAETTFEAFDDRCNPRAFMQSFLILDSEYVNVREDKLLERLLDIDYGLRIIYTNGYPAAVKYGMGLLEKAARSGILDLSRTST